MLIKDYPKIHSGSLKHRKQKIMEQRLRKIFKFWYGNNHPLCLFISSIVKLLYSSMQLGCLQLPVVATGLTRLWS
jgi:hypothetical protein